MFGFYASSGSSRRCSMVSSALCPDCLGVVKSFDDEIFQPVAFASVETAQTVWTESKLNAFSQLISVVTREITRQFLEIVMPRPACGLCYAPVTYLIEYVFTFTLRHENSPRSTYSQ